MDLAVRRKAIVIEDDSGVRSEILVLVTSRGVLTPLLNYVLHKQQEGRSYSWMDRLCRAVSLFIDYMEHNKHCFDDPHLLFRTFVKRMYSGTIGDDGLDPSGLYWIPRSSDATAQLISSLNGFFDWLTQNEGVEPLNPLVEANTYEQRLNYAAWYQKNRHDFLGHIKSAKLNDVVRQVRLVKGRGRTVRTDDDAVSFPENLVGRFFAEGFGGSNDPRVNLRDRLILLLMHGGGLRVSEALSLWVDDVQSNPKEPDSALVRVYHPEDGRAPHGWKSYRGQTNRAAYLREEYGLTPRNRVIGTKRLGWKTRVMDHKDNYIQVWWYPTYYGKLFWHLWQEYRNRTFRIKRQHPYAFMAFSKRHLGNAYTMNAYLYNYESALRRIGKVPSKSDGRDPHGHRHAYGRRLARADSDLITPIMIKKCLHHASLESQVPYTAPSMSEVTNALCAATAKLDRGEKEEQSTDWPALIEHGFEDIDPSSLFSGKHPKLRR